MIDELEAFRAAALALLAVPQDERAAAFAALIRRVYPGPGCGVAESAEIDRTVLTLGAALGVLPQAEDPS
jgi:hypothetical protein